MDDNLLQIREYNDEGYRPLIDFNGWRVAILNYIDEIHPRINKKMERHCRTDEVFVLLRGRVTLLIGGNGPQLESAIPQPLEMGKLYNVKQNTWHTVLMSRDASILLVENTDTAEANSEYAQMPPEMLRQIQTFAEREGFDVL
jgi:hypothetical protein